MLGYENGAQTNSCVKYRWRHRFKVNLTHFELYEICIFAAKHNIDLHYIPIIF